MPLFRRHDGDLLRDVPPVRAIMPYLMRGRNESAVYQESSYDVAAARRWLRAYNRSHPARATLFQLLAFACARALQLRPGLNRFASDTEDGIAVVRRECQLLKVPFAVADVFMKGGEGGVALAEAVGYQSQHYFSRAFKRVFGRSPVEYRKGGRP